jgi:putative DNA primase/helicase
MAAFEQWTETARAVRIEDEIERRGIKLKRVGTEHVGPCPKCGGDDRFAINTKEQVFNCRGCGVGGDVIELVQHLDSVGFIGACAKLTGEPPPNKANGKDRDGETTIVAAEFKYEKEDGSVAFAVERVEYQNADGVCVLNKDGRRKKSFRQKRPDPNRLGAWLWNVDGVSPVPYRLPELIEAIAADHVVFVVEGEKCANALSSLGVPATTNAAGAGKWKAELSKCFAGADVILLPDNDGAGFKHIQDVGTALSGIAKRIRVLMLPGLPAKGDAVDWLAAGGTREALDRLVDQAPEWQPLAEPADKPDVKAKATADEDVLLEALVKLPPGIEFARQRKKAAKELGVSPSAIDDEITARREKEAAPLYGHWVVEPWPEPVDGDSLLRDIITRAHRHVVCSHDDALAIALWIMLSWVHDEIATHSPILNVNSAEPESGKSTTLGLISFLAPRCVSSVEISEAALYRAIKLWQPSFAIDEFDSVLASDDKVALRSVINSGHTRGTGVIRCVGDDRTPELFPTFCAKAIGMCGRKLPAATLSRCIFVELRRKKASEKIEQFEHKDDAGLADLRRRLLRWSMDNEDALRDAKPSMPAELANRRADNWRVQLAIADLAGDDWGDKARWAAVKIEGKADYRTAGARALADARSTLCPKDDKDQPLEPLERISSVDLAAQLATYADSPWAEWKGGKPITPAQLARLLKPFGIAPQVIRLSGGTTMRGYLRTFFEDAWERYL